MTKFCSALRIIAAMGASLVHVTDARGADGMPSWQFSTVGSATPGAHVSSPALAFDHYGTSAVAWSSVTQPTGANAVRLSQLTGLGLWSTHELATGVDIGLRTALAFDRSERPVVAWVNSTSAVAASFNFAAAQSVTASGANIAAPAISLCYDLAGTLRGTYVRNSPTGNFFDIGYNGSSFSSANLATFSDVATVEDAVLAVDHRGLRQLAARAGLSAGGYGVVLASEAPGGDWASATFTSADGVDGIDIAVDPTDGRVAIAYSTFTAPSTSRLFYSKLAGAFPQTTQLLSSTAERYGDLSLAFDLADGKPAIAFERRVTAGPAEQLLFAWQNSAGLWQAPSLVDGTILMDAPGGRARRPSLAFDDFGTSWPAIAYVDGDGSLAVAFDPPAPEPAALGLFAVSVGVITGRRRQRTTTWRPAPAAPPAARLDWRAGQPPPPRLAVPPAANH